MHLGGQKELLRSMRVLLHGKEWVWVGDALCLTKDEDLHRRLAKAMFSKVCTCNGFWTRMCFTKN